MPENKRNQGGSKSTENLPQDVQRILEKARRGETLDHDEIGVLGGHDIELKDFGIEQPSEKKNY